MSVRRLTWALGLWCVVTLAACSGGGSGPGAGATSAGSPAGATPRPTPTGTAAMATATPSGDPLSKPVLQQSDFTYLGAFAPPQEALSGPSGPWSTAYATGGIALRHVNGKPQFFATTHVYSGGLVYEMNDPELTMSAPYPIATIVNPWGDIYMGHKCLNSTGTCSLDSNSVTDGLYYDEAQNRLYWSYGNFYNAASAVDPVFGYTTFGASSATAYGPWTPSGDPHSQVVRGGTTRIPAWFADRFTGGRTLGVGFGGYYNIIGDGSLGPALFAAADVQTTPGTLSTVPLIGFDVTHLAVRPPNYDSSISGSPNPVNGVGTWTWADTIQGGAIWLDLPTKQGMLFFATLGTGHICYKCTTTIAGGPTCGGVCADGYQAEWYIYRPSDLVAVAQGKEQSWQVQPAIF
jgi:hypothetical protein